MTITCSSEVCRTAIAIYAATPMHSASIASWPLRRASRLMTWRRSARRSRCRRRSKNSTNSCWAPIALSGLRLSSVSVSRLTSSLVRSVWARPAFLALATRKCTALPVTTPIDDRGQGKLPGHEQAQEQHDDGLDALGHELRGKLVGLLRTADLAAECVGDPAGRMLEQIAPARAQHLLDQPHPHEVGHLGVGVADLAHDVERDHRLEHQPGDEDDDQRAQGGVQADRVQRPADALGDEGLVGRAARRTEQGHQRGKAQTLAQAGDDQARQHHPGVGATGGEEDAENARHTR